MSEPKLISPLLDQFVMGAPISEHHGVKCCPAMENDTEDKYIVKVISVPATQNQMEALLLSGAYSDKADALAYFKRLADGIVDEVTVLKELSAIDGFVPYRDCQLVPMEDEQGFDVYLLGIYKRTLTKHFTRHCMTHLDALNLGLDLCASLSVCRKSGYLYIDLKPNNIYVTGDHEYRVGDLGFIRLDSLKYASLPDRYLSEYTAPEVTDAYSALNTTIDIYAAGLILYQAYNNGELPKTDLPDGEVLPPPLYADYEMSEIILKACAPNPEDRWQDPTQMGQAIISYMQRNGASDLPIGPVSAETPAEELSSQSEDTVVEDEIPTEETAEIREEQVAESQTDSDVSSEESGETVYLEDNLGNLCFLDELPIDETDPEYHSAQIDYAEVSEEVSDMLSQADELAAMAVPEPVVVPEYVEITIPEMLEVTPEKDTNEPKATTDAEEPVQEDPQEDVPAKRVRYQRKTRTAKYSAKKNRHWLRNSILVLILLGLVFCGVYYYQNYYLLPIDAIVLDGNEDSLTVIVRSDADESSLLVICSDTYGNQIPAPVVDGKALFTGLIPDTAYNIQVVTNGFHRLIGKTSTAYSTPIQTSIIQFSAVTGSSDGSVILSFTVDGPDSNEWIVEYSAEGEETQKVTFPSHTVTITGLTVGQEYTFRIKPKNELYITGTDTVRFTASKVILAQNLTVDSFMDGKLAVSWSVKDNTEVEKWTVRCYSDNYNETITTSNLEVIFENIDHSQTYHIEVTAYAMSTGQHITIEKDTVNAYDMTTDVSSASKIVLAWETSYEVPESGWVFRYWVDGYHRTETVVCAENNVTLSPVIPGETYQHCLEDTEGKELLKSTGFFTVPDALPFSCAYEGYRVTADDIIFRMCKTPDIEDWDIYDIPNADYKTNFQVGENASFLLYLNNAYGVTDEQITTLFVIYDADGNLVDYAYTQQAWSAMWSNHYCGMDIPVMPTEPNEYTMYVYFNGALAGTQTFSITA